LSENKFLIIIPTYNEKENIEKLVVKVINDYPIVDILIVEDNSPDGTAKIVERMQNEMFPERLFMLQRPGKLGLGTAYIEGFKWALARHYQYMIEMDADFSHDPKYLGQFFDSIKEYDLVLGSRYVKGGGVVNWGFVRKLISLGGSFYSRLVLKLPFKDLTGGFKCFRRKVLEAIDLDQVESSGYSFQIEMTYRAFLKGFKIKEVPIIFADRTCGKSKMSSGIFSEAFLMVLKLRIKIDKIK
jgi:dolichol-phosphate mannosyltransferase